MTVVYLSGKMTGLDKSEYEKNFNRAEDFYTSCGFLVINPCDIAKEVEKENPKASYEDYMKADLKALSGCTHIAMLDGWENSNGAKREKAEAERLGIEIMFFREIGGMK